MKVLVANWFSSRGGEEKHVYDVLSHLAMRGDMELHVAAPSHSPWNRELSSLPGVRRFEIPFANKADIVSVALLARLMHRERYDIVHVHGARAGWLVRLAAIITGFNKVVWTMHLLIQDHISRQPGWSKRFYVAIERFLNRRTARIVAVSENLRQGLLASDPTLEQARIITVPNGIDPPSDPAPADLQGELGVGTNEKVGLAVGKLQREKGHDILIKALAVLPTENRPHAAVAGTGMLKEDLERLAAAQGVSNRFHLLGFQKNVLGLLKSADFFVMPSRYEGFPIALLEAMALGKPIIAAAVNGIPEAIQDGVNGLLVPPEDEKALAAAIERLVADPREAARLGAAASTTYRERYTLARCCERITEVYDRLTV
jgi:glycosyltransferase involved in cell wall biosynthesis